MKIDILGSHWELKYQTIQQNKAFKDMDGYCDGSERKIYVRQYKKTETTYSNITANRNRTARHEIIHAFLHESGLWCNALNNEESWAMNEEMVDWIAFQLPKIADTCKKAGVLR